MVLWGLILWLKCFYETEIVDDISGPIYSDITQHWLSQCHLSQGFISLDTITNPEIILLCPSLDSNKAWVRYFFAKVWYCCHQHSCCLNIEHILFLSMSGSPMSPGCISPLSVTPMMTGDVSVMSWTIVAGEDKTIKSKAKISHCQSHYCCYYCQHSTKKATHWPCSMCASASSSPSFLHSS